ncbi:MAG: excinuclease ABC subunit UvrB [Candidatus Micrarchaeota archaeon]
MRPFELTSDYGPKGDQQQAIDALAKGIEKGGKYTLMGVTGSGKTFSCASVIQKVQRPTLVLCHNKTLAAQLYNEFKSFFPKNSVHYFVSYYDYYQPESYLPGKDVYIEKDAQVNARIEQLRLEATTALLTRKDVIIISSVSCIYGIGDPQTFKELNLHLTKNQVMTRKKLIETLVSLQYERNSQAFEPGMVRVQGDILDVRFGYGEDFVRIELFGDQIENLEMRKALTGELIEKLEDITIYPAKHFVVRDEQVKHAIASIQAELRERLSQLGELERTRLGQRTKYDLEMLEELGYCNGIENYSRHFENRKAGEPPFCLLDYFPKDFLMVIDESHVTLPQVHGMHGGDRSRKKNLIDHGFRLPSAYDNRPLTFEEFEKYLNNVIFTSATPADYEIQNSKQVIEQIVRPTGLVDPQIEVRTVENPIKDLMAETIAMEQKGFRTLVTTLTKKMAEDLTEYFAQHGVRVRYLHSEIDTLERTEIIRQLRLKKFDCLIGINLLREGLDIPEVALIGILDADKEGFLRNARSLIQTIGRAARNSEGRVILYANKTTDSMKNAMDETNRRREKQLAYNKEHGITPQTIIKSIPEGTIEIEDVEHVPHSNIPALLVELEADMNLAAEKLEFEKAIVLRDRIQKLEKRLKAKEPTEN